MGQQIASFEDLAEALVALFRHLVEGALRAIPQDKQAFMMSKMLSKPAMVFYFVSVDEILDRYGMRDLDYLVPMLQNIFRLSLRIPEDQAIKYVAQSLDAGLEATRAAVAGDRSLMTIVSTRAVSFGRSFKPWEVQQREVDDYTLILFAS